MTERVSVARQVADIAATEQPENADLIGLQRVLAASVVASVPETDKDRQREYEWLRIYGRRYRGRWVAVSGTTLLADAETLKGLLAVLGDQAATDQPLIHRIP